MNRFKIFFDFDKEEAWLNQMATEGHLLQRAGVTYSFAPIAPGSAVVRVDYRQAMREADYADYITLFAEAGWVHLSGSRSGGNQYFASFSGDPNGEIFSDASSKALRYRRALSVTATLMLPFFVIFAILFGQGVISLDGLSPRTWYLTPGLWEKTGMDFVAAFLFETPFALMRGLGPWLLIGAALLMLGILVFQFVQYRRAVAHARA